MSSITYDFPQFALLPAELQAQIWEASCPRPGMNIFDVCSPSITGESRIARAFKGRDGRVSDEERYDSYKSSVFLDALDVNIGHSELTNNPGNTSTCKLRHDPSIYKVAAQLRATCVDAASAATVSSRTPTMSSKGFTDADKNVDVNSVYLPGKNKWVYYNNTSDVLCLQFGPSGSISNATSDAPFGDHDDHRAFSSGLSDALGGIWSTEIAATLQGARRVAIDIAETLAASGVLEIVFEEISYLCCCIQRNLEVLYLVDHCIGRCQRRNKNQLSSKKLQTVGELAKELGCLSDREPNVIYGASRAYREIFDLEQFGWHHDHPTFVLAKMFDKAIRSQQGNQLVFQGVRVLVCEDEAIDGFDSSYCSSVAVEI
ncbi:hypothetical protein B0O99DRAFT_596640 [Bisporella sp. PMI_857]|nr:hypothetical protein B0O99DRAFT_596640 [Bisporella sp. PMI_857]